MTRWLKPLLELPLVAQIALGIVLGIALALISPEAGQASAFLGNLFVAGLKAVAPILVFTLVLASIANQGSFGETAMRPILGLYLIGTLAAALIAVILSFSFPVSLTLVTQATELNPPEGIGEVLSSLVARLVQNPITALMEANYIGILAWAIGLGMFLRAAGDTTKKVLNDGADAVVGIVKVVIRFAPIGLFGLVANSVAVTGFDALAGYAQLIGLLVSAMLLVALVVNPLLVAWLTRENPYPLVFRCLRESGITAFFTRSSAANIPVNLQLCRSLNLDEKTYSVSIPLGATVNMGGAAITVSVMTLAAVHTLGIQVDIATALLLCVISALSACGASGVAGGSLLLIPLACSLFGISNEIAMEVVAVGFIIGVVQDSFETALNSSTDVVFTAAAIKSQARS